MFFFSLLLSLAFVYAKKFTEEVHRPHKPGVYAPEKPPYYIYFEIPLKPDQAYHKPGIQQPLPYDVNSISPPDWKDPTFVSWFFQPKPPRVVDQIDGKLIDCRRWQ